MKKLAIIFATVAMLIGSSSVVKAQGKYGADSAECIKYLSYYSEYFKQKNYEQALPNWRKAYNICPPQARQSIFTDGTTLMRRLINVNVANKEYRQALIDTLMTLHDTRAKYYPNYAVTVYNNKGTDISNYYKGDQNAIYTKLNEIIDINKEKTKASILLFNLNAAIELYQNGDLDAEQVINTYQKNVELVANAPTKTETEKATNNKVKADMEGLFITSRVASCENLISLFTPRFDANPDDVEMATNIVKMMTTTDDCTDNDLFLRAATKVHTTQPTAQSAYFLYRLNASKDNMEEAIKFIEEALSYEDLDPATAADYNLQYATLCIKNGMGSKGLEAAKKVAELDSEKAGKAYYLIGTVWSGFICSGDDIQKRSKYWVACDYMNKAKAADPTLTDDCNEMIRQYSVFFPAAADAFMYDLTNGQSYTVSCGGMTAVTTVRTQK